MYLGMFLKVGDLNFSLSCVYGCDFNVLLFVAFQVLDRRKQSEDFPTHLSHFAVYLLDILLVHFVGSNFYTNVGSIAQKKCRRRYKMIRHSNISFYSI